MLRRLPLGLALVLLTGCSNSLPPEADPTTARAALKTVLDTWAKGGKAADLRAGNAPIIANDPDWEAGAKLIKYELDPTDNRIGVDLLVSVKLTLSKGDEKPREKTVNFSIAIGAQTVVLRQT
jgi:hypothetical protein